MRSLNEHEEILESMFTELQNLSRMVHDMLADEDDSKKREELNKISSEIGQTAFMISNSKLKAIRKKLEALK